MSFPLLIPLKIIFISLCFALFLPISLQAAMPDELYSAEVPVKSRDKDDFEAGLRKVLLKVLAKNSSSSRQDILQNPSMAGDLESGHRYVEQFSYRAEDRPAVEGEDVQQLFLKASFPATVIRDFLQRGNLKLWPANRPTTLVLPIVNKGGILMYSSDSRLNRYDIRRRIKDAANDKGIVSKVVNTRQLPGVSVNELWYWNIPAIKAATAEVKKDAVLVVRMAMTSDGSVRGGAILIENEKSSTFDVIGNNVNQFMQRLMASLADSWSEQYSINLQHGGNEQLIIVDGIKNHQDYTQMMRFLETMDIVEQVYLVQAEAHRLSLSISLKTDTEQFERSLSMSKKFQRQASQASAFHYHWQ